MNIFLTHISLDYEEPKNLSIVDKLVDYINTLSSFFQFTDESFEILQDTLQKARFGSNSQILQSLMIRPLSIERDLKLSNLLLYIQDELSLAMGENQESVPIKMNTLSLEILEALDNVLANHSHHPILMGWILYYVLDITNPIYGENETPNKIIVYKYLQSKNYGFFNLLNINQFIFDSKGFRTWKKESQLHPISISEILEQNLTPFLEICLQGFENQLKWIIQILNKTVRDSFRYDSLSLSKGNRLDYFLEKLIPNRCFEFSKLSTISQFIMYEILEKGGVRSPEIVNLLKLNLEEIESSIEDLLLNGWIEPKKSLTDSEVTFVVNFAI